jgi:hypothetical protein
MGPNYNFKAPNSVYALSKSRDKIPDFEPDLNYFVVQAKAKLTDLLSTAPITGGFLISDNLKSILEYYNLPLHKFFLASISYRKGFYNFHWLHLVSNLTEFIDYPNSIFFVYQNYRHNLGYVEIKSEEDYTLKKDKLKKDNPDKTITIWIEKIKFLADFKNDLDLFKIGIFDNNWYITERLRNAIFAANITGCEIVPAPQFPD